MEAIFVTGIVFFFVYKIIELLVHQKERRIMVEKMTQISQEMLQQNITSFNTFQKDGCKVRQFAMLRWGAAALGIGIGWVLGWILHYHLTNISQNIDKSYHYHSELNSIFVATIALCVGLALIIVYLFERKASKETKSE